MGYLSGLGRATGDEDYATMVARAAAKADAQAAKAALAQQVREDKAANAKALAEAKLAAQRLDIQTQVEKRNAETAGQESKAALIRSIPWIIGGTLAVIGLAFVASRKRRG